MSINADLVKISQYLSFLYSFRISKSFAGTMNPSMCKMFPNTIIASHIVLHFLRYALSTVFLPAKPGGGPHPPHHLRNAGFAQISLVLSVERQKINFKLYVAFDFALEFKTVNRKHKSKVCREFELSGFFRQI